MFYFANEFVNRISYRSHGPKSFEEKFPTWEQAHEWLVRDRERQVESAENALKSAKRSLQKARAMTRAAVQQSREGDRE
jgi:hypothetical protein